MQTEGKCGEIPVVGANVPGEMDQTSTDAGREDDVVPPTFDATGHVVSGGSSSSGAGGALGRESVMHEPFSPSQSQFELIHM